MGSFSSTANIFAQASEPAGASPGSLWSDTDQNTLFRRNDANTAWILQGQSGANSVGDVKLWCGTEANVPLGWLICDGAAISRTTRSDLFDMIGTEYGVGNGSTTFNIPDMQTGNQFPRGATNDDGRGNTGGASAVTLTGAESGIAQHAHTIVFEIAGGTAQFSGGTTHGNHGSTTNNVNAANAASSHNNEPQFVDFHYIINVGTQGI